MKKYLAISFFSALMLIGCRTYFPAASSASFVLPPGEPDLANGRNLSFNVCGQCHYNRHVNSFMGEEMRDLPAFMGKIYSANLTHGHIADRYSDRELFYLIKTGIAKDGRFIPYMVRPTIADGDLRDIIAYLRSDDEPLRKNDSLAGTTDLSWLGSLAGKIMGKPEKFVTGTLPPPANPVKQGRYLVDIMGCYHCHSKSITGLNYANPEDSKGYIAGGMKFKIDGQKIYAPDIRSHAIHRYTRTTFRTAVREGIDAEGHELRYPMRRFKHLTDTQTDAIFAYLKTLQ